MEFGHVYESIETVDFTLPPDTAASLQVLNASNTGDKLSINIGASKWGEKSWTGIIYPPKTPDKQFLTLYSQNFNTVEFGPTFYTIPKLEDMQRWAAQVEGSPDFKFCPKFPQNITHIRRLANAEEPTAKFYESLNGLGDHLGPMLLQLGDNFSPKSFPQLKAYLMALDPTIKVSVELRNKNWFTDADARREVFQLFRECNVGTVISDTTGRRDCVHMELTTSDAFIRFVGNDLDSSDFKRLDDWVKRIKIWADNGLKSLWFFMHQNNEKFVPEACTYFIGQINAKLGTSVKGPSLI